MKEKYNFIVCVEKLLKKGPTFYQTTANTLPTTYWDLCAVRYSTSASAYGAEHKGGDSVLVIVRHGKKTKPQQLLSLNGNNNTTKRQLVCAV